jgi:hypothetical protein
MITFKRQVKILNNLFKDYIKIISVENHDRTKEEKLRETIITTLNQLEKLFEGGIK